MLLQTVRDTEEVPKRDVADKILHSERVAVQYNQHGGPRQLPEPFRPADIQLRRQADLVAGLH